MPSSAGAAVTIGSDLSLANTSGFSCISGLTDTCTVAQTAPAGQYVSPIDGVIVRWRVKEDGHSGHPMSLRVLHPAPTPGEFIGAGRSATVLTDAGTPTHVQEFPAQLPIRVGDRIGLDAPYGQLNLANGEFAGTMSRFEPTLPDGGSAAPSSGLAGALLINADIEPDADCDGFGDETQDPSVDPAGCNPPQPEPQKANRTLALETSKNKVKKGKNVLLSGQLNELARQGPCESAQTVVIQRKKPSRNTFKTLAQVQTNAAGSFTLQTELRKTLQFRALVQESTTCGPAVSNTEQVKVKKRPKPQSAPARRFR